MKKYANKNNRTIEIILFVQFGIICWYENYTSILRIFHEETIDHGCTIVDQRLLRQAASFSRRNNRRNDPRDVPEGGGSGKERGK